MSPIAEADSEPYDAVLKVERDGSQISSAGTQLEAIALLQNEADDCVQLV